jgi:hypothetical protein
MPLKKDTQLRPILSRFRNPFKNILQKVLQTVPFTLSSPSLNDSDLGSISDCLPAGSSPGLLLSSRYSSSTPMVCLSSQCGSLSNQPFSWDSSSRTELVLNQSCSGTFTSPVNMSVPCLLSSPSQEQTTNLSFL